ncbi:hypothetical protein [Pyruvatibacter mobilis]|uniref:hypothetical protein n=1 Tax=Pyruvatibacter mobilis TaxID=1712261 RepID=UPI003C79D28F
MQIEAFLNSIEDRARSVQQSYSFFQAAIDAINFDTESFFSRDLVIPKTIGSVGEIEMRIETVITYALSAADVLHDQLVLQPRQPMSDLNSQLGRLEEILSQGGTTLAPHGQEGVLTSLEEGGFILATSDGRRRTDIRGIYSELDGVADACLLAISRISALSEKRPSLTNNLISELIAAKDRQSELYQELLQLRRAARSQATQMENLATSIAQSNETSQKNTREIENIVGEARGFGESFGQMESVRGEYISLGAQIESFKPTFESFRERLEDSEERLSTLNSEVEDAVLKAGTFITDNHKIISQAKEALNWGTASGLATSFEESRASLTRPIRFAVAQFYLSLIVLALSVLVATNSLPIVSDFVKLESFPPLQEGSEYAYFGRILSIATLKFLIVLPALVFLTFSLRNLNTLNRLRHEYGFKRTLSIALPSFREEAPTNKELIVAAAFGELMTNPSEAAHELGKNKHPGQSVSLRKRILERVFRLAENSIPEPIDPKR